MQIIIRTYILFLCIVFYLCYGSGQAEFFSQDFMDPFDEISMKMAEVNQENCGIKHVSALKLSEDSVSHIPRIKELNQNPVYPNRTALLNLQNIALTRAFFFSFSLQSRFNRASNNTLDPGLMYYYLSTIADVAANPKINASGIYFSPNMAYSPSYKGFFNLTFPLFAPRTYRADDYNDPIHLERISTLNMFISKDLGAIPKGSMGNNYTTDFYRINDWYKLWLPDLTHRKGLQDTKTVYDVRIRYANNTNSSFSFHGPNAADENLDPIRWTKPYFDCGRSNTWKVAAVVPIADIYPRHTQFRHIEYPTYTSAAVLEINYDRIDINQCPPGMGNNGPNKFADTAKCKKETTECEPLHGYGFRRGGYQCRCRPEFRLPNVVRRPFLGEIVERASPMQYGKKGNYDCTPIGFLQNLPTSKEQSPAWMRDQYLDQYPEYKNYSSNKADINSIHHRESLGVKKVNVDEIVNFITSITPENCHKRSPDQLQLKGDISYGADKQFENEALAAVRTANFLSAFLQVVDPKEIFSGTRRVDEPLSEDQMIGEAVAMVMGNSRIYSAGIYFDTSQFVERVENKTQNGREGPQKDPRHNTRTYFAPYAYKTELNARKFYVEDLARLNSTEDIYINKPWFKDLKSRWSNYFESLDKFWLKMYFRSWEGVPRAKRSDNVTETEQGSDIPMYLRRYEHFPEYYRAATLKQGLWSAPYYDCKGQHKMWKITYAAPFFGFNSLRNRIEFKGAVSVSMDLKELDINQCPGDYYVPNAFKRTHKCDERTSYCVPILGRKFSTGGYKCECKQGYEYPFKKPIIYYDGYELDSEFLNLVEGKKNWFDMYKCRLAAASQLSSSIPLLVAIFIYFMFKVVHR